MSVRPREAVNEASRFSLRSILGGTTTANTDAAHDSTSPYTHHHPNNPQPSSPTHAAMTQHAYAQQFHQPQQPQQPQPAQQPYPTQQPQQLRFNLGTGAGGGLETPFLPLAATNAAANNLKFTLPTMRGSAAAAEAGMENGNPNAAATAVRNENNNRVLRAGYITGGSTKASDPEIMRLNAVIDDLTTRLKKTTDRLAVTEQSVARGNKALTTERSMAQARSVAMTGEIKNAHAREASVRAEMAAMPKVSDYDQSRFEMQAQGAVELQAKYDEEVARSSELENAVATIEAERTNLTLEFDAIKEELKTARSDLEAEMARTAAFAETEKALQAELEAAKAIAVATAEAAATSAAASTAAPQTTDATIDATAAEPTMLEAPVPMEEATEATEAPEATDELVGVFNWDDELATENNDQTEPLQIASSLEPGELIRMEDEVVQQQNVSASTTTEECAALMERIAGLEAALATKDSEHEKALTDMKNACDIKEAESDVLVKSLDLKLHAARQETATAHARAATAEANKNGALDPDGAAFVSGAFIDEFKTYYDLKTTAETALHQVAEAGSDVTADELARASRSVMYARRALKSLVDGRASEPLITCVYENEADNILGDDKDDIDVVALRREMATNLNVDDFKLGICAISKFDCNIDLHGVSAATGVLTMGHTDESIEMKLRTDAYVAAVSGDIAKQLQLQQEEWLLHGGSQST